MSHIEILEMFKRKENISNYYIFLFVQKFLAEEYFDWINFQLDDKMLIGSGTIKPKGCSKKYKVRVEYSLFRLRYDRVYIKNPIIKFNPKIHMYNDNSLCLYYPKDYYYPPPLFRILGWLSEWFIKYEFLKKNGVWLGNEVVH